MAEGWWFAGIWHYVVDGRSLCGHVRSSKIRPNPGLGWDDARIKCRRCYHLELKRRVKQEEAEDG